MKDKILLSSLCCEYNNIIKLFIEVPRDDLFYIYEIII